MKRKVLVLFHNPDEAGARGSWMDDPGRFPPDEDRGPWTALLVAESTERVPWPLGGFTTVLERVGAADWFEREVAPSLPMDLEEQGWA